MNILVPPWFDFGELPKNEPQKTRLKTLSVPKAALRMLMLI